MIAVSNFEAREYNCLLCRQHCSQHYRLLEATVGHDAWELLSASGQHSLQSARALCTAMQQGDRKHPAFGENAQNWGFVMKTVDVLLERWVAAMQPMKDVSERLIQNVRAEMTHQLDHCARVGEVTEKKMCAPAQM